MEIDSSVRSAAEDVFERDVRATFQDTLGLIHIALVTHYGLEETEAGELEKDLYLWFLRFCMRPGNNNPRDSRPFLLVACCQFAREYQKYIIGAGVRATDDRLQRLLEREPNDVARDFSRSLELLNFRQSRCLRLQEYWFFAPGRTRRKESLLAMLLRQRSHTWEWQQKTVRRSYEKRTC